VKERKYFDIRGQRIRDGDTIIYREHGLERMGKVITDQYDKEKLTVNGTSLLVIVNECQDILIVNK